jgi:hypothetical protein
LSLRPTYGGSGGALAVGIAAGGVAHGYATGFSINQPTIEAAKSNALERVEGPEAGMMTPNRDAKSS